MLLGPFPEFSVAYGLRPSDPKDSSKASVDVWILFSVAGVVLHVSAPYGRTGFTVALKDPDFDVAVSG